MINYEIEINNAPYRWEITKVNPDILDPEDIGTMGPANCDEALKDNPQKFKLYDDDREWYASGILYVVADTLDLDYQEIEPSPLDQWGRPALGCTYMELQGKDPKTGKLRWYGIEG